MKVKESPSKTLKFNHCIFFAAKLYFACTTRYENFSGLTEQEVKATF